MDRSSSADVPEPTSPAQHPSDDTSGDINPQHSTSESTNIDETESQHIAKTVETRRSAFSDQPDEGAGSPAENNEPLGRFDYPLPPLPDSQSDDEESLSQIPSQHDSVREGSEQDENRNDTEASAREHDAEAATSRRSDDNTIARSQLPMRRSSAGGSLHYNLSGRRPHSQAIDDISDEMRRATLYSGNVPSSPRQVSFGTAAHGDEAQANPTGSPGSQEFSLPRWQPDAEVTYCPICHTQFSIFVRKHHCRKCGRVVCNSCSPHRIIIPHQYIVRPPGSEYSLTPNLFIDGLGAGYVDVHGASGGERVRLCNPCVPDPNTAPPQSPSGSAMSPRSPHQRSRSTLSGTFGATAQGRYGALPRDSTTSRTRSITMVGPSDPESASQSTTIGRTSMSYQTSLERFLALRPAGSSTTSRSRGRHGSDATASSRQRALPPTPQIAEEDECPICHHELPARTLPDFETLRENHINSCILSHSAYGSPRGGDQDAGRTVAPRRTGMYTYRATEKDCVDDAECTICLEEYQVNDAMCRLECLCRFHRSCITLWFVKHPGRCPVHQHDGFGF